MSKVIHQLLCFASIIESDFITGGYKCQRGHGMLSRSCKYLFVSLRAVLLEKAVLLAAFRPRLSSDLRLLLLTYTFIIGVYL